MFLLGRLVNLQQRRDEALQSNYIFYFKHENKKWCYDATVETIFKGRLLNHSRYDFNAKPILIIINNIPRIFFSAARNIYPNEEITYDYGDRSKNSFKLFPWLNEKKS